MQQVQAVLAPRKPRVLVVEDNPAIQKLLSMYLRDEYDTVVTKDTEHALRTASTEDFDAFLIDIQLESKWSGVDLLKEIQSMRPYRHTPKIACTGLARIGDRERFLDVGFDGYLSKPFRKTDVITALRTALDLESNPTEILPEGADHF